MEEDRPTTSPADAAPILGVPSGQRRRPRGSQQRKTYRVLVMLHEHLLPPEKADELPPEQRLPYQAEFDVISTLKDAGHEVSVLPLASDLAAVERAVREHQPHVAFNLIEAFNNYRSFDQHVVAFLECLGVRYTGCNPRGMTLARDKALTKKILAYHRIRVPAFLVFEWGRKVVVPKGTRFPLLIKSATDDGSIGITKASVVHDEAALRERVAVIHEVSRTDAIAEQYIEGRELYLGLLGNRVTTTLPVWELDLKGLPDGSPRIVTERMKTSIAYQKRYGIDSGPATLTDAEAKSIRALGRRVYHVLGLSGFARLDLRMTPDGKVYLIEANPNPQIAKNEDFAKSAAEHGIEYSRLLEKLVALGVAYRPFGLA